MDQCATGIICFIKNVRDCGVIVSPESWQCLSHLPSVSSPFRCAHWSDSINAAKWSKGTFCCNLTEIRMGPWLQNTNTSLPSSLKAPIGAVGDCDVGETVDVVGSPDASACLEVRFWRRALKPPGLKCT